MWDPYAEFQSTVLPNGLTVYAAHWPERTTQAMRFLVHSGAEQDPVGKEGAAHFVEHMASKSLSISPKEFNRFFKQHGGYAMLGATSSSYTEYGFYLPASKEVLSRALSMFGSMLVLSSLSSDIENERRVILNEFNRRYPLKFDFERDMREHRMVYPGYWLERATFPLGVPESVTALTLQDLQSYYDQHYTPANISIVGVGMLNLEELLELIVATPFGCYKPGVRTPLRQRLDTVSPPLENRYVWEASQHLNLLEPMLVAGYRSVSKIPGTVKRRAVGILMHMLDEILDDEVRQKRGWAYQIDSQFHNLRYFYEFAINSGVFALEGLNYIEEIVENCLLELKEREDLFEEVKSAVLATDVMCDVSTRKLCERAADDIGSHQRIITISEDRLEVQQTSMKDIHHILTYLRPEWRWTRISKP